MLWLQCIVVNCAYFFPIYIDVPFVFDFQWSFKLCVCFFFVSSSLFVILITSRGNASRSLALCIVTTNNYSPSSFYRWSEKKSCEMRKISTHKAYGKSHKMLFDEKKVYNEKICISIALRCIRSKKRIVDCILCVYRKASEKKSV